MSFNEPLPREVIEIESGRSVLPRVKKTFLFPVKVRWVLLYYPDQRRRRTSCPTVLTEASRSRRGVFTTDRLPSPGPSRWPGRGMA